MKLPLITSAPHDGESFAKFANRVALDSWQVGEFSDKYTTITAYHPNALGNLKSIVSRGLGSLNQPRDFSLFKLKDFHGNTIWKDGQNLTQEEKEYCFETYYDPYHSEIKRLIKKSKQLGFDKVILWDQHDTGDFDKKSGKRDRKLPGENRTMPKFILSNCGIAGTGEIDPKNSFTSCPAKFIQKVQEFVAEEFKVKINEVEINTSYKGGHIVQFFGIPKNNFGNNVYTIQIEYNRGFVMDQSSRKPNKEEIKKMNLKFRKVMEKSCRLVLEEMDSGSSPE